MKEHKYVERVVNLTEPARNINKFSVCSKCLPDRIKRMQAMNLGQIVVSPVQCDGHQRH